MANTILEQELRRKFYKLRVLAHMHDRAVLLGFLFCLLPIFPVALFGLGLGLFHHAMHKAGKISSFDYALVRRGLIVGAFNSVLSIVILIAVVHFASNFEWRHVLAYVPQRVLDLIQLLWGEMRSVPTGRLTT